MLSNHSSRAAAQRSNGFIWSTVMSERDPFDQLGDLIDEPVSPRAVFADELRSRLMRELSASELSREEHAQPMDAIITPRPPLAFPIESPRRIRPMVILEVAAAAIIILALAATLGRGWFGNDPDPATSIPAAALQGNETPTPASQAEQTPTAAAIPTEVPEGALTPVPGAGTLIPTESPNGSFEPTVVPPGNVPETLWAIPGPDGDIVDFGGLLVEDGTVYRLLATTGFIGVQAVDGDTGTVEWQQAHQWSGNLFALEDDLLYFDGGDNQIVAVNAETGTEQWRTRVEGNPIAIAEEDDRVFVLLDTDFVTALDEKTGDQLWVAQGTAPQNATSGSASIPAIGTIAVEGDTVAAISSYGVLSGFDVATGTERWSHAGYDAASVSILTEDDRFIVASGAGLPPMSAHVSESNDDGHIIAVTVGSGDCGRFFEWLSESGSSVMMAEGTPETGSVATGVGASTFRVEAIDPATGNLLWGQQAISSSAAATEAAEHTGDPVACVIDSETGQVGVDTTGQAVITIGQGSGDSFGIAQSAAGDDVHAVVIGTFTNASEQPIAAEAEDGAVYLQLADGSLVKVAANGSAGDDDHHDDEHDHSEDTPESDDD
jgi:outer membrane protein assembly factor BamB